MRREISTEAKQRAHLARHVRFVFAVVAAVASLAGCLDVLDGAVYRPRGDVVAIDAVDVTADRTVMDARDERASDVVRTDLSHAETTPPPDALPPDDVAEESNTPDAVDVTTDVMEI